MLSSLATILSPSVNRNYAARPSLQQYLRLSQCKPEAHEPEWLLNILQKLNCPIEGWMIQEQKGLQTYGFQQTFYRMLAFHSDSHKNHAPKATQHRNQCLDYKLSIHNTFVLVGQEGVLDQILSKCSLSQLQVLVDGVCCIYQESTQGTLDELTCTLHYILTHSQPYHRKLSRKSTRPLAIHSIPHLTQVYSPIFDHQLTCLDNLANAVPMFVEMLTLFEGGHEVLEGGHESLILKEIPWLTDIATLVIDTLDRLLVALLETFNSIRATQSHEGSLQVLEAQFGQSKLAQSLRNRAKNMQELEGFVAGKNICSFACQIFMTPYLTQLQRQTISLSLGTSSGPSAAKTGLNFCSKLLNLSLRYQCDISEVIIMDLRQMVLMSGKVEATAMLYEQEIADKNFLNNFVGAIKSSAKYNYCRHFEEDELEFLLESSSSPMVTLLNLLYLLKLQYLPVLEAILNSVPSEQLELVQFYLIKSECLHFLVEQNLVTQTTNSRLMTCYYSCISKLIRNNPPAYAVLDEIIRHEISESPGQTCPFVESISKNFAQAKDLLLNMLVDYLKIKLKYSRRETFHPLLITYLLQKKPNAHEMWISYIHSVIVRDLKRRRAKHANWFQEPSLESLMEEPESQEINEWVTLSLLLQIMVSLSPGEEQTDFALAKFIMGYLSNIMAEEFNWSHHNPGEGITNILSQFQEWDIYYTHRTPNHDEGCHIISHRYSDPLNYTILRKWNSKILQHIKLYLESVREEQGTK